jgi:transposase
LSLQARRKRFVTAQHIRNDLQVTTWTVISSRTVLRRLRESNLTHRKPATGPRVNPGHRMARLNFAREHRNWDREWHNVLFTDDLRFCLTNNDRRNRVFRRPGERYSQCAIHQSDNFGGGSVMVWAGINWTGRTELVVVAGGSMTGQRYRDDIVIPYIEEYAHNFGAGFVLMDDNARPHIARIVIDELNYANIQRLDWRARSPVLNPIEHLWDNLGRRVRRSPVPPLTLQELSNLLIAEWQLIPQEYIQNLISSLPRRMEACITTRGRNIRY